MNNAKPRSRLVLEELSEEGSSTSQREIISQPIIREPQTEAEPTMPRRSGRVVRQPDQYMFLGESYERIPDELDAELVTYNEAFQDKDIELWKKAIKS